MKGCDAFRGRLAARLSGPPRPALAQELGWHRHLATCEACRELLAAEEALEAVLASLPEPALPPGLAERVLARLKVAREEARAQQDVRLDRLLDAVPAEGPEGLAERVLVGLAGARARAAAEGLDELLQAVPAEAPEGLAERVLAGLAAERAASRGPVAGPGSAPRRRRALPLAAAAAAAALALAAFWRLGRDTPERPVARAPEVAGGTAPGPPAGNPDRAVVPAASGAGGAAAEDPSSPPPPELLLALDVLKRWDLLVEEDLEILLAALDPVEEELLGLSFDGEDG